MKCPAVRINARCNKSVASSKNVQHQSLIISQQCLNNAELYWTAGPSFQSFRSCSLLLILASRNFVLELF